RRGRPALRNACVSEYRQVRRLPAMHKPPAKGQKEGGGETVVIAGPMQAPALAGTGVAVLVAGPDAAAVGAAVAALPAAGWVGDPSDEAAREMAAELFPGAAVALGPAAAGPPRPGA